MIPVHCSYEAAETLDFPGAITLRVLLSGDQTDGTVAVFEDLVQPGVGPGRHIHHGQDETFFFLEGAFDVEVAGELHQMQPGDVAFIPRETVHAFKNVGDTVGRLRYVFSPALKMEAMFRAFFDAQQTTEVTEDVMREIAANHGQSIVGPPPRRRGSPVGASPTRIDVDRSGS